MTAPLSWLPAAAGAAREAAILEEVRRGRHDPIRWTTIRVPSFDDLHVLEVELPEDALKLEGVRVNVTARTAQQIADLLGCVLPTPRIVAHAHVQAAVPVYVGPRKPDATMATTAVMIARSRDVDAVVGGRSGLVSQGAWKHWVLAPGTTKTRAANYGWMRSDGRPWQSLGLAHNLDHTDYSQAWQCPRRRCRLDGREMDLADVLRDAALARLLTWDGQPLDARQPGVLLAGPPPAPPAPRPAAPAPPQTWIPARNYTPASRAVADVVVLHTTEGKRARGAARAVARWFGGSAAPKASAHYIVDDDEVIACVAEGDVAWAAPGANHDGIQIEMCGYARQTHSEWLAGGLLERAAELTADICRRHQIPIARLYPEDLAAGARGISGHVDASRAFRKSDHWDPGPSFPWTRFLELVAAAARKLGPEAGLDEGEVEVDLEELDR
ncbi:peptidoglycan recognition family protein [Sorangium sp. So ce119]|uniref:N-acetylmuramoyl-L-alanine amidase n=1 Tax=Sorangium sp. So ce119 TaxID=3133279 RepID=UPI003F648C45